MKEVSIRKVLGTTKKNISRNKWLSMSTIFVISIVFTISSFFIAASFLASSAVKYYETRAQVIVFFDKDTPEEEIFTFRDSVNNPNLVESIEYISKEDALKIYKEDFKEDPDLVDTITTDTLPPSLGIRATSIENLEEVITVINEEKEKNAFVDEVFYFKDVVDNMKTLSKVIGYGSTTLITGLGIITFTLIMITIGFNIQAHKDEIEIMHLVGSPDSFIKMPFVFEGAFYGAIGGFVATMVLIVPWFIMLFTTNGSDLYYWIGQFFNDLSLGYLGEINWLFAIVLLLVQTMVGIIFGVISSYTAVLRYLRLSEK